MAIRAGLRAWRRPGVGHVAAVALAVFVALLTHLQFDLTLYSGNLLPLFFGVYGVLIHLGEKAVVGLKETAGGGDVTWLNEGQPKPGRAH